MAGTSTVYGGGGPAGDVYFNYTPLVDVTFNLILYFVLTSTLSGAALARIQLPHPEGSVAVEREKATTNRIVISVVSASDDPNDNSANATAGKQYEIDGEPIKLGDQARLVARIKAKRDEAAKLTKAKPEDFYVEIRADRRIVYNDVAPILLAAVEAKIANMNITALVDVGGGR